eukprot:521525-Prorocentrum_minimum.AAC.2
MGPPVPITARVHSTPQRPFVYTLCIPCVYLVYTLCARVPCNFPSIPGVAVDDGEARPLQVLPEARQVVGEGQILAGAVQEPQAGVDGVVVRLAAVVVEAVRNHALRLRLGEHAQAR